MENQQHFHIKKKFYLESLLKKSHFEKFRKDDFSKTSFLEIKLDNERKKAFIILKNELFEPITEVIEDDWYAIMDCIHEDKWNGKYTLVYK